MNPTDEPTESNWREMAERIGAFLKNPDVPENRPARDALLKRIASTPEGRATLIDAMAYRELTEEGYPPDEVNRALSEDAEELPGKLLDLLAFVAEHPGGVPVSLQTLDLTHLSAVRHLEARKLVRVVRRVATVTDAGRAALAGEGEE